MPDSHSSALHNALDSGERISPTGRAGSSDRADWITWTMTMPPEQADFWDEVVKRLAAATGRRVRRGGRATADGGVSRRDLIEALVELADKDPEVWEKLVEEIRVRKPK